MDPSAFPERSDSFYETIPDNPTVFHSESIFVRKSQCVLVDTSRCMCKMKKKKAFSREYCENWDLSRRMTFASFYKLATESEPYWA